MFTGIVTDIGEVIAVRPRAEGLHRLKIACRYERASIVEGASIACAGVCLTVVGVGEEDGRTWFAVDAAAETLRLTTVGRWRHGTRINLERALKVGDELGGHIVAGHVDGLAALTARDGLDRDGAACAARAGRACPLHRAQRARSRSTACRSPSTRSPGDTFSVLVIPAYLEGDDARARLPSATRSISKSTSWRAMRRG